MVTRVLTLADLLREAAGRGASDLHVAPGFPPTFRVAGELVSSELPTLSADDTAHLVGELLAASGFGDQFERFLSDHGELDCGFTVDGAGRVRTNVGLRGARGADGRRARRARCDPRRQDRRTVLDHGDSRRPWDADDGERARRPGAPGAGHRAGGVWRRRPPGDPAAAARAVSPGSSSASRGTRERSCGWLLVTSPICIGNLFPGRCSTGSRRQTGNWTLRSSGSYCG